MNLKNTFGAILMALSLVSCKQSLEIDHPEKYEKVYMPQAVGSPEINILQMADTAQILIYGANFGGIGFPSKNIPVHFEVKNNRVSEYNNEHDTHYLIMPEDAYELESTDALIPKGKLATDPLKLKIFTHNKLEHGVKYLLPIHITSTGNDSSVNKSLATTYYIVQAKYDLVQVFMENGGPNPVSYSFNVSEQAPKATFRAGYRGTDPEADIHLAFEASPALTDSFNLKNGTGYLQMPSGSFSLNKNETTIPEGEELSPEIGISFNANKSLVPFEEYLLPIRIKSLAADLKVNKKAVSGDDGILYLLVLPTRDGVELKIMSFGKNSGDTDLVAIADFIKTHSPDLLLIRQLDVNTTRSGPKNQPEELAQLLGMPYYAFANGLNYQGGEYGSAIFSKFPITASETQTYMLPSSRSEKAPLAIMQVVIRDSLQLTFAGVHLNANDDIRNNMQVPELISIMDSYDGPVILAGNFNAIPSDVHDTFNELAKSFALPLSCTDCTINSEYRDEYIMYKKEKDFMTLDYKVIDNPVSKYDPVVLNLKWFY